MFVSELDGSLSREEVGGKAASLGRLRREGFNVPDGFVVTTTAYNAFAEKAGINTDALLEDDVDAVREAFLETDLPETIAEQIKEQYENLSPSSAAGVAVRSSAVDEDGDDTSFAGQQDTFLSVTEDALLAKIKECWASLFTDRAVAYRDAADGIDMAEVSGAVIVQEMVNADASGVLFTSNPISGRDEITIEASYGFGEAVVAGEVSPDRYVLNSDGSLKERTINRQETKVVQHPDGDGTVYEDVASNQQDAPVLDEEQLTDLFELAEAVREVYGEPQDVEWAYHSGNLYVLQSRPITSIQEDDMNENQAQGAQGETITVGLGVSPGAAQGTVVSINGTAEHSRVNEGDILVTSMTTPDMLPAMRRASAVITDDGGTTCHAAIVARELGVPAVVGTGDATTVLDDGMVVGVDGSNGEVFHTDEDSILSERNDDSSSTSVITATDIKVNVSIPEAAERARQTNPDGIGLLRMENIILGLGQTPRSYIDEHGKDRLVEELKSELTTVLSAFNDKPVRIRTLDAPTDEFRNLDGGENEPEEHNPMLGYRGIRRDLAEPDVLEAQLRAFAELRKEGYEELEFMFPLVNDPADVNAAKQHATEAGIDLDACRWGVMIETPASALQIDDILETGVDFVSFGTNDLTQYTLAVDRNNEKVADRFDERHPAVITLLKDVIEACRGTDVETSICGEAASDPAIIEVLVEAGIDSLSVNIDAVSDTRRTTKKIEERLTLDDAR